MSIQKEGLISFIWSFSQQSTMMVINFIASVYFARMLMPSDFGFYAILLSINAIVNLFADGGLSVSLIRKKNVTEADYSSVMYLNLLISILLYLLIFFFSSKISVFFEASKDFQFMLKIYSIGILISALSIAQSVKLTKNLKFKEKAFIGSLGTIVSIFTGIIFINLGFGVWSLILKDLIFQLLVTLMLFYNSKWFPKFDIDTNLLRYHFNFSKYIFLSDIASRVFKDSYKFVIAKHLNLSVLGYFNRAMTMQELPTNAVFSSVNRVMFPLLSQVQDDDLRLKRMYRIIIKVVTFLVTPFLIFLYLIAEPLFSFLLTEKWLPAVPFFRILIFAGIIAPLQPYLLNICKVKGRSDLVLKLSIVEYIFISIGLLLIIPYGINGLLWSLVGANLAKLIIAMYFAGRLIKYTVWSQVQDLKDGFGVALVTFLTFFFVLPLDFFQGLTDISFLLLVGFLFTCEVLLIGYILKLKSFYLIIRILKNKGLNEI